MDTVKKGCVVMSAAGRDSGKPFVVVNCDEQYAFLCDGKIRPVENPKKKKQKHLRFLCSKASERLTEKLENNTKIENAEIRKALSNLPQEVL